MSSFIINDDIINEIISLYNRVFKKNANIKYWRWRFDKNPFGRKIICFIKKNKKVVGTYLVHPLKIEFKNKINLGLFSMWTVTNPNFEKQGIMTQLANQVYEKSIKENFDFVIGFANENSHYMFVKKLNFVSLGVMNEITIELPVSMDNVSDIVCKEIPIFEEEFTDFYNIHKKNLKKAMIPRTAEYLNWRFIKNPEVKYYCYKLLKNDQLLGYFILKNYENKKCHIIDFLLKENSIVYDAMFFNTMNFCKTNNLSKITFWINGLNSFNSYIKKFDYKKNPMENNFILKKLQDKKEIKELSNFENWYLTMSDSDVF